MATLALSPGWARFLRQQQLYIAIAVAIYAIFWAIEPQRSNVIVTLLYTLCLCNLTVFMQNGLAFLYVDRQRVSYWLIYLLLLLSLTPVMVVVATSLVFWVDTASGAFWYYLESSWKFPLVAILIFGIASQIYHRTKHRLERRNRELQHAVQVEIAQRELQEQELQRAREIQQSLLPKQIPQVAGFDISGTWEPARVVGGDYFDVMKLSDHKIAVCIADVVGKSVSAALLMASVQATVRAFASESSSPSCLCSRVNAVLCNNIASGKFVTLFYGVLDGERRTLEYTNAGHLRPILIGESGSVKQLENGGALLGVFPDWKYEDSSVQLSPGDRLLLYTDGITEAANAGGEEFGEDRLICATRSIFTKQPTVLQTHLLSHVKSFCDSQLQDDATLIVIAVESAKAPSQPIS
jgi:phosphoserine phosphatase RsbU/P